MDRRIVALDGLRGAAILYVMLGHFGPEWLHAAGSFGVTVFFALSGRLMADVLFIGNMDWREFAVRRLARLYPALLFFLACMVILSGGLGRTDLLADWWCYPIFAVNLVVTLAARFPPFDHLWSVSLEVQAYAMLALIAVCFSGRRRLVALLAGALFGLANGLVRTYIGHQNPFMVYWRPDVGTAVIFGAAFLRLMLQRVRVPSWTIPIAFGTANGLMLVTTEPWASATVNGVLLAFVAATAERSAFPVRQLFESRPLVFLGTISYSLYIWQQLFKYAYEGGFPLFGAVILSIVVAIFSYYRVELPGKSAILSIWRRRSVAGAPGQDG
ncbi:putative acyltransferase [uncultured Pleomorphomonas sp.]|uniref:Putative acyltransferase n=1 Tax=uncultured Pleomorphomonas sp. TaxID=442121 RepID=A0A212LA42_9HYPH|nr:acyltransferase [uncultured Pleomorphomonas sp.]SCM74378.1 putative acyltransferase [uncultured Pleomorphomonas sp.]